MGGSPEVYKGSESTIEAQNAAAERSAELSKSLENSAEQSPDARKEEIENARSEANKEALLSKERSGAETKQGGEPGFSAVKRVTKKQKAVEYKKTMSHIQSQMSSPARSFSKIIHNPIIDRTSEALGKTVARPNAILAGSTTALVLVATIYIIARQYGYALSGFETIAAFITGWVVGVIFDYIRAMITGGIER